MKKKGMDKVVKVAKDNKTAIIVGILTMFIKRDDIVKLVKDIKQYLCKDEEVAKEEPKEEMKQAEKVDNND